MIPKIINYVRLSSEGELSSSEIEMIEKTKENNPSFDVNVFTEKDIKICDGILEHEILDYMKLYLSVHNGGITLDTTVAIKEIDKKLLNCKSWNTISYSEWDLSSDVIASMKNSRCYMQCLIDYKESKTSSISDILKDNIIRFYGSYRTLNHENGKFQNSDVAKILFKEDIENLFEFTNQSNFMIHYV
jgi:hypothetical protein